MRQIVVFTKSTCIQVYFIFLQVCFICILQGRAPKKCPFSRPLLLLLGTLGSVNLDDFLGKNPNGLPPLNGCSSLNQLYQKHPHVMRKYSQKPWIGVELSSPCTENVHIPLNQEKNGQSDSRSMLDADRVKYNQCFSSLLHRKVKRSLLVFSLISWYTCPSWYFCSSTSISRYFCFSTSVSWYFCSSTIISWYFCFSTSNS